MQFSKAVAIRAGLCFSREFSHLHARDTCGSACRTGRGPVLLLPVLGYSCDSGPRLCSARRCPQNLGSLHMRSDAGAELCQPVWPTDSTAQSTQAPLYADRHSDQSVISWFLPLRTGLPRTLSKHVFQWIVLYAQCKNWCTAFRLLQQRHDLRVIASHMHPSIKRVLARIKTRQSLIPPSSATPTKLRFQVGLIKTSFTQTCGGASAI